MLKSGFAAILLSALVVTGAQADNCQALRVAALAVDTASLRGTPQDPTIIRDAAFDGYRTCITRVSYSGAMEGNALECQAVDGGPIAQSQILPSLQECVAPKNSLLLYRNLPKGKKEYVALILSNNVTVYAIDPSPTSGEGSHLYISHFLGGGDYFDARNGRLKEFGKFRLKTKTAKASKTPQKLSF